MLEHILSVKNYKFNKMIQIYKNIRSNKTLHQRKLQHKTVLLILTIRTLKKALITP